MKKIICLLLAAMLAVLSSCGKEADFTDSTGNEPTVFSTAEESTATAVAEEIEPIVFRTETETVAFGSDGNQVTVKFPVLENTGNDEAVNAKLKSHTEDMMTYDVTQELVGADSFTYEITDVNMTFSNDSFASFLYLGSYYPAGGAHPTEFVRTVNIALKNAEIVVTTEIISDIDAFSELFTSGKAFELISSGNENIDKEISETQRNDISTLNTPYFINDNNTIYIGISVETLHALGDHAEYKARLSDVEHLLSDEILELTKGNK